MRRSLPPLNALRSFDAAARHQSFTRAAEELCVTQGAVTHSVKALETELGLQLFKRERNGLVITDAGRDYLAVVRDVFERLELGTDRPLQRQRSGTITVSTSPDFCRQMARQPAGTVRRSLPRDRAQSGGLDASRRFRTRRCGPRDPAWRWAMAGARRRQSLHRGTVSGLQSFVDDRPRRSP